MKTILAMIMIMFNSLLHAQEWNSELDVAIQKAKAEDKLVLLYFSVPEDCDICQQLEDNVWKSEEFKAYAKANYILAKPDFDGAAPIEKKAENLLIVEKYNKDGFFPLVVLLDINSKVLGKTGIYNGEEPVAYLKMLASLAN